MNKEYKKTDDIPVGGIMVRKNGKKYEAVNETYSGDCVDCAFDGKDVLFCLTVICSRMDRTDEKGIIFIRRKDLEEKKEIGI